MSPRFRALSLAAAACAALLGTSARAEQSFPAHVTLNEVLGFRSRASLKSPAAIRGHEYLGKGARLKLLDSTPDFGTAGAFCHAEAQGHRGYIRCDKPSAFTFAGASQSTGDEQAAAAPAETGRAPRAASDKPASKPNRSHAKPHLGSFCSGVEPCKAFCTAHCTLDPNKWASKCTFPGGLGASIPAGHPSLKHLPAMAHVKGAGDVRVTDDLIAGLQRLEQNIASSSTWPAGHTAYVKNCHRPHEVDSTRECDFILKGWHVKEKFASQPPTTSADKAQLANANHWINPAAYLGLTWPGDTPHSAGLGCDIVVRDPHGKEVTACAGKKGDTKTRALSKALVDALTNDQVGAVRLNYEMWHFEFTPAVNGCRCKGDDCNNNHWPILCDGPQHCQKPM